MPHIKTDIDEQQWLRDLQLRSGPAIARLLARLRAGLAAAFAGRWGVCEADLDDFAQESVIRVMEKLDTFRGDSRLATWAMAIAIRLAFTNLRRRRWNTASLDAVRGDEHALELAGTAPAPEHQSQRDELLDILKRAIERDLTEHQRTAILAELADEPQVVLAQRLGITRNALYKLNHDARKRLRRSLEACGFDMAEVIRVLDEASY